MEVEWKFLAADGSSDAVPHRCAALGWQVQPSRTRSIEDSYFDTPDLAFFSTGGSLRRRREDSRTFFTIKGKTISRDGLFRREELEGDCALLGGDFLDRWGLREVLTVQNTRRLYRLRLGEAEAELALDRVCYRRGSRSAGPELQVELELKSPAGAEVFKALGQALGRLPGLTPMTQSKYLRGMALTQC